MSLKGMSDKRQSRPTFVGVVELPDKIGEPLSQCRMHVTLMWHWLKQHYIKYCVFSYYLYLLQWIT